MGSRTMEHYECDRCGVTAEVEARKGHKGPKGWALWRRQNAANFDAEGLCGYDITTLTMCAECDGVMRAASVEADAGEAAVAPPSPSYEEARGEEDPDPVHA